MPRHNTAKKPPLFIDAARTFATLAPMSSRDSVTRFSMSLPASLAKQLDRMCREKGYDNRSLALADMIRNQLVEHQQQVGEAEIAGTITLVYDHHRHGLQEELTDMQHDHHEWIVSTLHVHLDHHNCLEVLVVRGPAARIRNMADRLIGAKGVKHGKLTITTTGKGLPG
jgi:CopG family nickel-responsive transcriptional regulator